MASMIYKVLDLGGMVEVSDLTFHQGVRIGLVGNVVYGEYAFQHTFCLLILVFGVGVLIVNGNIC